MISERAATHERRKLLNVYDAVDECVESHDEWPIFPTGTDPMAYLSRYRVAQPFFLAAEHDQLVIMMAGNARVFLPGDNATHLDLELGDFCYLPAGQLFRFVPQGEVVHLKYKAEPAGFEAAIWLCEKCGAEVFAHEFDASVDATAGYRAACEEFNGSVKARTCGECGHIALVADLADIVWASSSGTIARQ